MRTPEEWMVEWKHLHDRRLREEDDPPEDLMETCFQKIIGEAQLELIYKMMALMEKQLEIVKERDNMDEETLQRAVGRLTLELADSQASLDRAYKQIAKLQMNIIDSNTILLVDVVE